MFMAQNRSAQQQGKFFNNSSLPLSALKNQNIHLRPIQDIRDLTSAIHDVSSYSSNFYQRIDVCEAVLPGELQHAKTYEEGALHLT